MEGSRELHAAERAGPRSPVLELSRVTVPTPVGQAALCRMLLRGPHVELWFQGRDSLSLAPCSRHRLAGLQGKTQDEPL